jgi:hypothetical protein
MFVTGHDNFELHKCLSVFCTNMVFLFSGLMLVKFVLTYQTVRCQDTEYSDMNLHLCDKPEFSIDINICLSHTT